MKLANFARLGRKRGCVQVVHVGSEIWLGCGAGIYRAPGLQETVDERTILSVLDYSEKEAEGVRVVEIDAELDDVLGMDLRDDARNTATEPLQVVAMPDGVRAKALLFGGDRLVFYDEALLSPLADVLREHGEYVSKVIRGEPGRRYIIVYDGLQVVAALVPMQICTREFVGALRGFADLCARQIEREEGTA